VKKYGHLGGIISSIRKTKKLSQKEMSKVLDVTQSTLSKVEKNKLGLDAYSWVKLCEEYNVDPNCIVSGYLDFYSAESFTNQLSSDVKVGKFLIPDEYAYLKGTFIRDIFPFLEFFKIQIGKNKLNDFIQSKNVDPDYFRILSHSINIQFLYDLINVILSEYTGNQNELTELITHNISNKVMHGQDFKLYKSGLAPKVFFNKMFKNIRKYDLNFDYHLNHDSNESINIEISKGDHLYYFDKERNKDADEFLFNYRIQYIKQFSQIGDLGPLYFRQDLNKEGKCTLKISA